MRCNESMQTKCNQPCLMDLNRNGQTLGMPKSVAIMLKRRHRKNIQAYMPIGSPIKALRCNSQEHLKSEEHGSVTTLRVLKLDKK